MSEKFTKGSWGVSDCRMDKRCANCKHCIQNYPTKSLMCVDSEEAFFVEENTICGDWEAKDNEKA